MFFDCVWQLCLDMLMTLEECNAFVIHSLSTFTVFFGNYVPSVATFPDSCLFVSAPSDNESPMSDLARSRSLQMHRCNALVLPYNSITNV